MSIEFGKGDILFEQRLLACGGFYKAALDGKWGKISEKAAADAVASFAKSAAAFPKFDVRSEKNVATLLPLMQVKAREILRCGLEFMKTNGISVSVLSGTRTYAEQDALYRQRPKVTNARGGQSNHNFGIALDVGLFKGGKYLTGANRAEEKAYADFAKLVKASVTKIEWGGDWKSFPDMPHYEYSTGLTVSQKRAKFESGNLFLGAV